jgi:flagellar motor component MotA
MKGFMSTRLIGLVGIVAIFIFVAQESAPLFHWLDIKAALLVFLTPWFVLMAFRKDRVSLSGLFSRLQENRDLHFEALVSQMLDLTKKLEQGGARAELLELSEKSPDRFLRYCAGIYSAKFKSEELSALMQQKIEREDETWQGLNLVFGFLAKMAPYFGMLATVMGMMHLLKNMQDFSKISSGMALALQGTLYGLISFVLIYSPLQKWCTGFREIIYRRNSLVANWFLMASEQKEPALIRATLEIESRDVGKE